MSKRLVLSDSDDDADNLKKKRIIIAESDDDDEDDNPCYNVEEFDKTGRMLRLCGYDKTKASKITMGIYNCPKLTNIAVSNTPNQAINVMVRSQSTVAERTVSFDKDASPAPAFAAAASTAYSSAVATATEESSEDDDNYSLPTLMVGGACSGDGADNMVKLTGKTDFSTSNSDRRQLDPNAEWLSCFVPQEHDSGVLTAYVPLFYTFLSGVSITSHVEGLNNVTHINKLLSLKDLGTQFLGGFLPGWLNLIFDPNFGWKSFTMAVLDGLVHESKKALKMFNNMHGNCYVKATHLQKKSWIAFISVCLANSKHASVILFCQRVLVNLSSLHDDDWYTLYCSKTICTFENRMSQKDPRWFLDWFPSTHIFRIAVFRYSGPWNEQNRNLMTGATHALEAGNAAWLNHILPGLDDGHSFNIAPCEHRFLPPNLMGNIFVYVSFEMIEGACVCALSQLFILHVYTINDLNVSVSSSSACTINEVGR